MSSNRISLKGIAQILEISEADFPEGVYIENVCAPGEIRNPCVVFISDEKQFKELSDIPTLLVVSKNIKVPKELEEKTHLIRVENAKLALALVLRKLYPPKHPVGISKRATLGEKVEYGEGTYIGDFCYIGNNVRLGRNVKIYPGCYIGNNTQIGDNTVIYPNCVIYPNTVIGKNVIIHSGTVLGSDGFGYVFRKGEHIKIPHIGVVVVENNVEIGANTTIDRALLEKTVIGEGTKIDNLVQVGHNCKLGRGVILVSQVGLSGSVEVKDYAILAGQVGVADHVKIGRAVRVAAKSGVISDLEDGKTYGANLPAVEWERWKRIYVLLLKLPEIYKTVKKLAKKFLKE
jgi:UDP-3-O-[3-hydroxymyristoyl] glucosamine N-acyltransferase